MTLALAYTYSVKRILFHTATTDTNAPQQLLGQYVEPACICWDSVKMTVAFNLHTQ